MTLHTKYRPKTFDEFVGNRALVKSLESTIGQLHTYLLCGARGCGKTTAARIIASELNISNYDLHEVNIAYQTGVDDARRLIEQVPYLPWGERKMYILDEFHRATGNAQDCWLKTLEEPPQHAFFVLCTTEPDKVITTVRSRAAMYKVSVLPKRQILGLLERVCQLEELVVEPPVLAAIAGNCGGVPREALVRLEMCCDIPAEEALTIAKEGSPQDTDVLQLFKTLTNKAGPLETWQQCALQLQQLLRQKDPEQVRRALATMLSSTLLTTTKPAEVGGILELFVAPNYASPGPDLVLSVMLACATKK